MSSVYKNYLNQSFTRSHYRSACYNSRGRMHSFADQLSEIMALAPRKILEIGMGSGFVRAGIRTLLDCEYCTLDTNKELAPDLVGDVRKIPLADNLFDFVLCCEVLEHLDYDDFKVALSELARMSTKYVLLTLPDAALKIKFDLPLFRKKVITLPCLAKKIKLNHSHFWEINAQGYPLRRIIRDLQVSGFSILKNYLIYENCNHRLLLLKK